MANTFSLISRIEISTNTPTITISNIPSSFDDLVIRWSARLQYINGRQFTMYFNSLDSTNYTTQYLTGINSNLTATLVSSTSGLTFYHGAAYGQEVANLFGIGEVYINQYKTSSVKNMIANTQVIPPTATPLATANVANVSIAAGWNGTSAISSITFTTPGSPIEFTPNTNFWLYGIKNT